MSPQFVDFNADGHVDIFTATFDGSPWVAYGSEDGFKAPSHVLDKDGERIILSRLWDYDERKWTSDDHTDGNAPDAHCISAVAFDWDNDGDFDIVMGDRTGRLFLQLNDGTNKEPAFPGVSSPVMAGDEVLDAGGKITAPRMVDWDGDGLADIVVGTFGDTFSTKPGGGVKWFRNVGEKGAPKFQAPKSLITDSPKDADTARRPDAGLYVDVADMNGDGKLDLVVGGYSIWADEESESSQYKRPHRVPYVWIYHQKGEGQAERAAEETAEDDARPEN